MSSSVSSTLRDCFGEFYDHNSLYFITVQGPTGSGKSTFAKAVRNTLRKLGFLTTILHLDGFYNFVDNSKKDEKNFDYDNPRTINWDNVEQAVKDIIDKKPTFSKYKRTQDVANQEIVVENKGINIVIIEGIYAGNLLGKKKFNITEYDPNDSGKVIETPYIDNPLYDLVTNYNASNNISNSPWNTINTISIRFRMCFDKMKEIRVITDAKFRNLPVTNVVDRLNDWIYDATRKWVFSNNFEFDIEIQHGNFNTRAVTLLQTELFKFFRKQPEAQEDCLTLNLEEVKTIKCTSECQDDGKCRVYIPDNQVY